MYNIKFYWFTLAACASLVYTQSTNITISLDKTLTFLDKELYGDFIQINGSSTVQVNFINVNPKVFFIIFQVHSHLFDVALYQNEYVEGTTVTGTNIGLYSLTQHLHAFYIVNAHENALRLFISVQGYGPKDPVPGGCNIEFPVPISPFLRVTVYNKTYIYVDAAPPQIDVNCLDVISVETEFYILYLPEHNFDADTYFDAIRTMTNYQNLLNGNYVREIVPTAWPVRRMLSAYPGTGAVYVAIAALRDDDYNVKSYSMYVPSHSYACSPLVENDCELLVDPLSMLICAVLLFIGIFISYFGHTFFKTQIFVIGFLLGTVLNYILLSVFFNMDHPALLASSVLSGVCVGGLLLVFWWLYGLPIFIIVPFCFQIGFLIACIFYYIAPAHIMYVYLSQKYNFWSVFFLIMVIVTICLISVSHVVNILCCTVIGGYVAIYSLDYYIGSNMKYILNNIVRRAAWRQFSKANMMPTFQFNDWVLSFLWIVLIITGFLYQFRQNKGKPPFPPPPRSVIRPVEEPVPIPTAVNSRPSLAYEVYTGVNEKTPLLA